MLYHATFPRPFSSLYPSLISVCSVFTRVFFYISFYFIALTCNVIHSFPLLSTYSILHPIVFPHFSVPFIFIVVTDYSSLLFPFSLSLFIFSLFPSRQCPLFTFSVFPFLYLYFTLFYKSTPFLQHYFNHSLIFYLPSPLHAPSKPLSFYL